MDKPVVCFIAISYQETNEIYMFIGALLCMKNPLWKCIVYHDGPNPWMKQVVEGFNDSRITYIENEVNTGSWGCYNRIKALEMVDTDYIVNCTIQEYFAPILVDCIANNQDADIIMWDMPHHQFNYEILKARLIARQIDWSSYAIRTEIAKAVPIRFPTSFIADGLYIEDIVRSGLLKKAIKIDTVLCVKN